MRASAIQAEGKALTHALRVILQGRVGDFHVIFYPALRRRFGRGL
jgi:hypothetical protein